MEKKKILAFGTFDLLHPGHLYFLKEAKKQGDYLMVIVARDINVKKQKGYRPQQPEKIRLKQIKNLKFVDQAQLGEKDLRKKMNLVKKFNPDLICLGYDQKFTCPQRQQAGLRGGREIKNVKFKIKKLMSYYPKKYKSSLLRNL